MRDHALPEHPGSASIRLLERFLLPPAELNSRFGMEAENEREVLSRLGDALWDIFSDNHTVFDANGAYALGSFRGSAGFIADVLNHRYGMIRTGFDYLDFYMGSGSRQQSFAAVYQWIFAGLKAAGCDWLYSFPRLYVIRFDADDSTDMLDYDPGKAVQAQLERQNRDARHDKMVDELERAHEESLSSARHQPLPVTVAAYRAVYDRLPTGWPHPDMP